MIHHYGNNLVDIDPNSEYVIGQSRNGAWLEGTYSKYLRPKYSVAIRRWNKDTGGGSRDITNFHNYCPSVGDAWLTWVNWLDQQQGQDFLLTSAASGVPNDLKNESGSLSSLSLENDKRSKNSNDLQKEVLETNEAVKDLIGQAKVLLEQQQYNGQDEFVRLQRALKEQEEYKRMYLEDSTLSPDTREKLINKVNKRKRKLQQKILEMEDDDE